MVAEVEIAFLCILVSRFSFSRRITLLDQSLGWEDPLEKEMATHSTSSSLENSMDRGASWATTHKESDMTEHTFTSPP